MHTSARGRLSTRRRSHLFPQFRRQTKPQLLMQVEHHNKGYRTHPPVPNNHPLGLVLLWSNPSCADPPTNAHPTLNQLASQPIAHITFICTHSPNKRAHSPSLTSASPLYIAFTRSVSPLRAMQQQHLCHWPPPRRQCKTLARKTTAGERCK